jgi:hypothetical protein
LVFVRIHDALVIEVDLIFFPVIIASEIDIPKDMEENGDDDEEEPSPEFAGKRILELCFRMLLKTVNIANLF